MLARLPLVQKNCALCDIRLVIDSGKEFVLCLPKLSIILLCRCNVHLQHQHTIYMNSESESIRSSEQVTR